MTCAPAAPRAVRRLGAALALLVCAACATPRGGGVATAMPADTGWLEVDGGRIYYEVAGRGPALVLLHGGYGDQRMWDGTFGALAQDFRVVRYDHRGFGRSPEPTAAYSPVADLSALLDHLGIRRAHVVGNSMGGALAIDFALLRPERVMRLVVVSSGANGYPASDAEVEGVVAVFREARNGNLDRAVEMWLDHPMVAVASRDPEVAPRLREMVEANRGIFRMQYWPTETLDPPAHERLDEVRATTLVIVGEQDTPLVREIATAAAEGIEGARLVTMPGTDHLPQMERPAEFARIVSDFLSG